jgi:hypothetical protein
MRMPKSKIITTLGGERRRAYTANEVRAFVKKVRLAERQACAKIAEQWDVDRPDTNYGKCISRLIMEQTDD